MASEDQSERSVTATGDAAFPAFIIENCDFGDTNVLRHNGLANRNARDLTPTPAPSCRPSEPSRRTTGMAAKSAAPHARLVRRDELNE